MPDTKIDSEEEPDKKEEKQEGKEQIIEGDIFKQLPPEVQKVVEIGFSMQRFAGPLPPPFLTKINEEHISKILESADKGDERSFTDAQSSKKYILLYVLIFSALFVFATVFLVGKDVELYKEILKLLAVYLGGLGSGFGLKGYLDRKKE
jgi:hypothetical protein